MLTWYDRQVEAAALDVWIRNEQVKNINRYLYNEASGMQSCDEASHIFESPQSTSLICTWLASIEIQKKKWKIITWKSSILGSTSKHKIWIHSSSFNLTNCAYIVEKMIIFVPNEQISPTQISKVHIDCIATIHSHKAVHIKFIIFTSESLHAHYTILQATHQYMFAEEESKIGELRFPLRWKL